MPLGHLPTDRQNWAQNAVSVICIPPQCCTQRLPRCKLSIACTQSCQLTLVRADKRSRRCSRVQKPAEQHGCTDEKGATTRFNRLDAADWFDVYSANVPCDQAGPPRPSAWQLMAVYTHKLRQTRIMLQEMQWIPVSKHCRVQSGSVGCCRCTLQ